MVLLLSSKSTCQILVQKIRAKILSPNQIAKLFDHQYLWKEYLSHRMIWMEVVTKQRQQLKLPLLVQYGQACLA